jgi:hypothetical protein
LFKQNAVLDAPLPLPAPSAHPAPAAPRDALHPAPPAAPSRVPWFIKLLLLIDVGLGVAYVGSTILFTRVLPEEYTLHPDPSDPTRDVTFRFDFSSRLFDLDSEQNVPTWYASIKLLSVAVLLTCFAQHMRKRGAGRWTLWLAAAVFFVLSLDEYAQIHECVGSRASEFFRAWPVTADVNWSLRVWVMVFVPPLLAAIAVSWRGLRPFLVGRPQVARRFLLGFGIFLFSAAGIELMYHLMSPDSVGVYVEILFEEVGEMIGVTLILWATYALLVSHGLRPNVSAMPHESSGGTHPTH